MFSGSYHFQGVISIKVVTVTKLQIPIKTELERRSQNWKVSKRSKMNTVGEIIYHYLGMISIKVVIEMSSIGTLQIPIRTTDRTRK